MAVVSNPSYRPAKSRPFTSMSISNDVRLRVREMQSAYDDECIPTIAGIVKKELGSYYPNNKDNKDDTYVRSFIRAYVDLICDSLASDQLYPISKILTTDTTSENHLQYLNTNLILMTVIPVLQQWKKDSPEPAVQTADLNKVYGSLKTMLEEVCNKVTYDTRKSSFQSIKKFLDENIELLRNIDDLDTLRFKTQLIWDAAKKKARRRERPYKWSRGLFSDDIDLLDYRTDFMLIVYLALLW